MKEHNEFIENIDPGRVEVPSINEYEESLRALHEFELLCWQRVESGELEASVAEEAIWAFIAFVGGEE